MNKSYKLLKDLPDVKAGAIFEKGEVLDVYFLVKDKTGLRYNSYCYGAEFVEVNNEWFEEVVQRDWEIVKIQKNEGNSSMWESDIQLFLDPHCLKFKDWKIHSVKRLGSNPETFTVGDEVTRTNRDKVFKIVSFSIRSNVMIAALGEGGYEDFISEIHHVKKDAQSAEPPPLGVMPEMEKYKKIADIISRIYFYGGFKAETSNEKILESLLTEVGLWPTTEDEIIKRNEKQYSAKTPPQKERIVVTKFYPDSTTYDWHSYKLKNPSYNYVFKTNSPIPEEKFPAIKAAIEKVLNGDDGFVWTDELVKKYVGTILEDTIQDMKYFKEKNS